MLLFLCFSMNTQVAARSLIHNSPPSAIPLAIPTIAPNTEGLFSHSCAFLLVRVLGYSFIYSFSIIRVGYQYGIWFLHGHRMTYIPVMLN